MKDDLISRQAAIDAILTWDKFGCDERCRLVPWREGLVPYVHLEDVIYAIANLSSVPVRKGKWILVKGSNGKDYHKCSYCLHTQDITGVKNYCSVCGARMEGAEI